MDISKASIPNLEINASKMPRTATIKTTMGTFEVELYTEVTFVSN